MSAHKHKWTKEEVLEQANEVFAGVEGFDPTKILDFVTKLMSSPLLGLILKMFMGLKKGSGGGLAADADESTLPETIYAIVMAHGQACDPESGFAGPATDDIVHGVMEKITELANDNSPAFFAWLQTMIESGIKSVTDGLPLP